MGLRSFKSDDAGSKSFSFAFDVFSGLLMMDFFLIFKNREIFCGESKGEDACRENPNGDCNFRQGREVAHVAHEGWEVEHRVGMLHCKPTDVEAIEDHPEQDDDRASEQTVWACAILFDGEPYDGCNHADENFSPEEDAHYATGEEIAEIACDCKFAKFEQGVAYAPVKTTRIK